MKIRTKILTAVLAVATAFSCALTASALSPTPKITLDNNTMPAKVKDGKATATLTLKSSNFTDVTGAKLTITFPQDVKLESAKITDGNWVADQDYKVDTEKGTVTLVDVFNIGDAAKNLSLNLEVTVSGVTMKNYELTVSGEFADQAVDQVHTVNFATDNTLVIGREEASATNLTDLNNIIANANDYFIPYGGAYIGNTNLRKNTNGDFVLGGAKDGTIGLLKCKLPVGNAVTTFGVSKGLENFTNDGATAIQFGSYVNEVVSGYTYGTLFIAPGNATFEAAVKYYKENTKYTTEADILKRFIEILTTNNAAAKALHTINFNNKQQNIKVAYVPQSNYMWKDAAKGEPCSKLQYAVRYKLTDENKNTVYTAVGYSYDTASNNYNFSTEIKSSSYNAMP